MARFHINAKGMASLEYLMDLERISMKKAGLNLS